jgi:hypothetical protein
MSAPNGWTTYEVTVFEEVGNWIPFRLRTRSEPQMRRIIQALIDGLGGDPIVFVTEERE